MNCKFYFYHGKIQNRKNILTMSETEIDCIRNEFEFLSRFFDEILIVLLIVIFDKTSSLSMVARTVRTGPSSISLRLFLEAGLEGLLHWPYNVDNLY